MATERKYEGMMSKEAAMEVYRRMGTPGHQHKLLASMAGNWLAKVKWWTEPGKPPEETTGSCERRMIMGGRFLHEEFFGEMMGSLFTGISITGYDNNAKQFVSIWLDSMSTGIMLFEGSASADNRTISCESRYDDPVKGPMKLRTVTRILDDNTNRFEMYGTDRSGKEEKIGETTYTRKQ